MNLSKLQIAELENINDLMEKESKLEKDSKKLNKNKINKKLTIGFIVMISLILLLLINYSINIYSTYLSIYVTSKILATSYIGIYALILLGLVSYFLYIMKNYNNLKNAFLLQKQTELCKGYEEEKEISLSILNHYKTHHNPRISKKAKILIKDITSNSIHSPFINIKDEIINDLDKEANKILYSSAKEVSLFTAFSPGSALDSIVVIYSSLKLMKKIFNIYGYKTNFFTLMLIIRKILENASLSALIEYSDDSISDLLGNTLISKISTKVAQGLANGVLILRVGNILIQSARPFASDGSINSYKNIVKLFIKYIKDKVSNK